MSARLNIGPAYIAKPCGYGPAPAGLEAFLQGAKKTVQGKIDKRTKEARVLADYEERLKRARLNVDALTEVDE